MLFILTFFVAHSSAWSKPKEKKQPQVDLTASVATLTTSKMSADHDSPWFITPEDSVQGLATYLGNNLFLTTSSLAARATQITLKMQDGSPKFSATPAHIDIERGVAILKVENVPLSAAPVNLDGDVKEGTEASYYVRKFKSTQITRFSGRIFDVITQRAPGGLSFLPFYLVKSQSKYSGRGEPVFANNQLIGLTIGLDDDSMMVIPSRLIKECLNQYQRKQPPTISRLGITYHGLQSLHHRNFLKVPPSAEGVVVDRILDKSVPFKKDDVLTKVGNYSIDTDGNIQHPEWGSIHFSSFVVAHDIQEKISVEVFRQAEKITFETPLVNVDPDQYLIPSLLQAIEVPHYIFAGLVLRNLDLQYLEGFGRDWFKRAPAHFLKIWFYNNDFDGSKKRVVILQRVLPDAINFGFETEENLILNKVNNETCDNLQECVKLIRKSAEDKKEFTNLKFYDGSEFVARNQDAASAERRIRKLYQIPETAE